jgi:hypothetical protein
MSLCSHHVSVSDLQLKTGAIVNPPRSWTTSTTSATIWVEEVWKTWCEEGWGWILKIYEHAIYYHLFTFWILLVYILHFVWSFNYVQCYNALCFGRGYPILTQVQFPPASCGSRAQAVWPHRRLPDLCPVLVRWWGCTARAGDVFGFFRWCLWGHTWCMGVG